MNYHKLYDRIIENRREIPLLTGYGETHHIVPKSLGGSNDSENLIKLSAREHFICHYLLTKMYLPNTREWHKMIRAFIIMNAAGDHQERYINSRLYESRRQHFSITQSISQSGKQNSQHGTRWIHNMEMEANKKIPKEDDVPHGWNEGRVPNFLIKKKQLLLAEKLKIDLKKDRLPPIKELEKRIKAKNDKEEKIKMYKEYYVVYKQHGFKKFVEYTGYDKSHPNLLARFADYVEGYEHNQNRNKVT